MFQPKTIHSFRDYTVRIVGEHPVFAGVREEDLTFRRGVAGFFARGHHEPPPGAEILARLVDPEDGEPIVYVDRVSTAGVILVHAGNDLIASVDRDSTAGRIAEQLVGWMLAETARLPGWGCRRERTHDARREEAAGDLRRHRVPAPHPQRAEVPPAHRRDRLPAGSAGCRSEPVRRRHDSGPDAPRAMLERKQQFASTWIRAAPSSRSASSRSRSCRASAGSTAPPTSGGGWTRTPPAASCSSSRSTACSAT